MLPPSFIRCWSKRLLHFRFVPWLAWRQNDGESARLHGLGALDVNHPLALGLVARAGHYQANHATRQADVLLALGVSGGLIVWMRRLHARAQALLACGLALIVGGALGNMIDRLTTGRGVDFIHVHWGRAYFPAFNIADSAITIGAVLLLLDAWRESRRAGRPKI